MKTILYLHAGAEMYGADKILLQLVTGLDKERFRPIVVLPNDGVLREKLLANEVETYVVPYPILRRKYFTPKGIFSYVSHYKKACKNIINLLHENKIKIDIIHVNTMAVLEGIYLKKKLNAKLYWHVHEIILSPKPVAEILKHLVGNYSDEIIAVSEAVRDNLIYSNKVSSKIQVVYNGIDSNKFNPKVDYKYLLNEWKIPNDSIRVGMIGRVNGWKGQDDFLDATVPLLNKYSNLYLFIVGSAFEGQEWRVEKLKKRIYEEPNNNRIIYSEYRNDNAVVENMFNILVLPSTNPDPLPTVVLEAMGCGKAVVGYRHGGIKEMVVDEWNGLLATPKSTNDLKQKIDEAIINKKYEQMGKNSRERQVKYFSLQTFIGKFQKLYDKD